MKREVDKNFILAMEKKLQHGRELGYVGWDQNWKNTKFPTNNPTRYLISRLMQEVVELIVALEYGDSEEITLEAADVANFAMFIADYQGGLLNEQ